MAEGAASAGGIATIDAVRGFAGWGILFLNVVALGMPGDGYVDPTFFGPNGPAAMAAPAFH